jgi:lysophospholipase L1-like esterase
MLPLDCAAPVQYVALGDSTVVGVGASSAQNGYVARLYQRLRTAYPRAQVTNLGVSGATAADVARGQLSQATALRPTLVTISVGPNDITQGADVQQYGVNLEIILADLKRSGAVVIMNLLPDLGISPRFSAQQKPIVGQATVVFNEVVERLGRLYGVEVVDLYHTSQQEFPAHPEYVSGDNYHPSDAGYARWAEVIWGGIEARTPTSCRK